MGWPGVRRTDAEVEYRIPHKGLVALVGHWAFGSGQALRELHQDFGSTSEAIHFDPVTQLVHFTVAYTV